MDSTLQNKLLSDILRRVLLGNRDQATVVQEDVTGNIELRLNTVVTLTEREARAIVEGVWNREF